MAEPTPSRSTSTGSLSTLAPAMAEFVCVPGSHKANYPIPEALTLCEEEMGMVKHVEMKAGDVLIFMGASQSHGAYPWMNETPRRGVIVTYKSRNLDLTFER